MKLFLSPHDDDNALFGAFTCIRENPVLVVVTDSYIQPNRGEEDCTAEARAAETEAACKVLGIDTVIRLGISDAEFTEEKFREVLTKKGLDKYLILEAVYAPAVQGGNEHHDIVGRVAKEIFVDKVIEYPTYTRTELYTTGSDEIIPTDEERRLKKEALNCYVSQLRVNIAHFKAVLNKSEWLGSKEPVVFQKKVYLGAGIHRLAGYIHVDKLPGSDVVCDVTKGTPFQESSIDFVYTQDFLEHIAPEQRVPVINEIYRILKPGGVMEHYIPNAGSRNSFGSPSHLSFWNLQCFEHFDKDSYRWATDRQHEGFLGAFEKITAELVNWQQEEDGINRAQSIHVKYRAVKPC